jgi:UDP-N-acetylmuramyl pentapeptide phosphotransferase/UDP-N-acetylglucosamine-1-phosphate transferase
LTAALVAFAVALLATPGVRFAAVRFGWVDVPGPRSSHTRATPRAGGVALLAALAAVLVLLPPGSWAWPREAQALLLAGGMLALVGLADDRRSLPAAPRLLFQALAAAGFVALAGGLERMPLPPPLDGTLGGPVGPAAAIVWIMAVVNFYNFLDGIDGLAALQGAVTGLGVALAGWDGSASLIGAALAGGCAAFLFFNWSPARIFLGDVGSMLLGFAFAALPLLAAPAQRPRAVFFVAISLWLFLADAAFTLLRRFARGARWHEAHREHLYQRLVATGASHPTVALAVGGAGAVLTGAALLGWREPGARAALAGLLALALFAAEWGVVRAREAQQAARRGAAA